MAPPPPPTPPPHPPPKKFALEHKIVIYKLKIAKINNRESKPYNKAMQQETAKNQKTVSSNKHCGGGKKLKK